MNRRACLSLAGCTITGCTPCTSQCKAAVVLAACRSVDNSSSTPCQASLGRKVVARMIHFRVTLVQPCPQAPGLSDIKALCPGVHASGDAGFPRDRVSRETVIPIRSSCASDRAWLGQCPGPGPPPPGSTFVPGSCGGALPPVARGKPGPRRVASHRRH